MITKLQPGVDNWTILDMANCYQFAIGLRKDLIDKLMPGDLSGHKKPDGYQYSDGELVSLVIEDLNSLGYEVQKCEKDTFLNSGEWEIIILNGDGRGIYDFHFLAKFENGGEWFQKFVDEQFAEYVNSPETCEFDYNYNVVGYYKIKKAKS